jgi:hypothetical protein
MEIEKEAKKKRETMGDFFVKNILNSGKLVYDKAK